MRTAAAVLEEGARVQLAECLFFAVLLRGSIDGAELTGLLGAVDSLTGSGSEADVVMTDSCALAVLFALLSALEADKLTAADLDTLRGSLASRRDRLGALLRLAVGLSLPAEDRAWLQAACDDGAFAYLQRLVDAPSFRDPAREWPDAYVVPAHDLVAGFLQDRGRFQVQLMRQREPRSSAFWQLVSTLAALYAQGASDLAAAFPGLWDFVDYAVEQHHGERSAASLMPLLALLHALAPVHSPEVWERLHPSSATTPAPGNRMCSALLEYCQNFSGEGFGLGQAALFPSAAASTSQEMVPEDADALAAYLLLLQQLLACTSPHEAAMARVQQLEARCLEGQALVLVLFTLLDFPRVPPRLRAALLTLITAFATETASALKIWGFLSKAAIVQIVAGEGEKAPVASARTDMYYELAEVESREEAYPETLALVRLVNKLVALCEVSNQGPVEGAGVGVAHFFRFVRDAVFLAADRRTYKYPAQQWELLGACVEHFRLLAHLLQNTPSAHLPRTTRPPGDELLRDLENDGLVLRSLLGRLSSLVSRLGSECDATRSRAAEDFVRESLAFLFAAISPDKPPAQTLSPRFDANMARERQRLHAVVAFAGYGEDAVIAANAVSLLRAIALRNDRLPASLDCAAKAHMRQCVAAAMQLGLATLASQQDGPSGAATTVLRLLLDMVPQPTTPNLGHVLLGFELTAAGGLALSPSPDDCQLLSLLLQAALPDEGGVIYAETVANVVREHILQLLFLLAADQRTGVPTVALLRRSFQLAVMVNALLSETSVPGDQQPWPVSVQHQRAWLLRLAAVMLHKPAAHGQSSAGDAELLKVWLLTSA